MNNKTQRRIHKYFFSHYFCFVFFRENNIRGNAATNNTPNEGEKKSSWKSQGSRKVTISTGQAVSEDIGHFLLNVEKSGNEQREQ
jgi:hypothetical protein